MVYFLCFYQCAVLAIERVAHTYDGRPIEYRERYVNISHHAYLNVLGMK